MTDIAIAQTALPGRQAGLQLGTAVREQLGGPADALIVFASPRNDFPRLLEALEEASGTTTIVGCSSAGEFTSEARGEGLTNVTAIRTPAMRLHAAVATGVSADPESAAGQLAGAFQGPRHAGFAHRAALLLVDALAGRTEAMVDALTIRTGGTYRFAGGGAGDDDRFRTTHVFCGTRAYTDAAVALEIVSTKPIGIGARHGWAPVGPALRVTESVANRVVSFNGMPAVEVLEEHAARTRQRFDPRSPMPFFLHNVIGIDTESGHKLRVPLGVTDDGAIECAAEVPAGAVAHIMSIGSTSAADAAVTAARDAVAQVTVAGGTPRAALFFDCVATRLRLGHAFDAELAALAGELAGVPFAGCNSYGQIVRCEGQFGGFHNCTAVVCVLPE